MLNEIMIILIEVFMESATQNECCGKSCGADRLAQVTRYSKGIPTNY